MSIRDGLWLAGEFRDDEPVVKGDGSEAANVRRLVLLVAKQGGVVEAQRVTYFPNNRNGEPTPLATSLVGLQAGTKVMVRVDVKVDTYRPANPRIEYTAWELHAAPAPSRPTAVGSNGKAPAATSA